jgi:hypothetical protein
METKNPAAVALGSMKSEKKTKAAQENGKLGGRPKIIRVDTVVMGMKLEEWRYLSCMAQFGAGPDWATLYFIESKLPSQGHATTLLTHAKKVYEREGKKVYGSVALSDRMAKIYKRLDIPVPADD